MCATSWRCFLSSLEKRGTRLRSSTFASLPSRIGRTYRLPGPWLRLLGGRRSGDFRRGGGPGGPVARVLGGLAVCVPVLCRRRAACGDGWVAAVGGLDSGGVLVGARDGGGGVGLAVVAIAGVARRGGRAVLCGAGRDGAGCDRDGAGGSVALSLNKLKRLGDAGLVELFEEDRKLWTAMAKDAYSYTRKFVGSEVRPDDVVPTLVPALEVSDRLRTYLASRKLTQNYWYVWFAELLVDRLWPDLHS